MKPVQVYAVIGGWEYEGQSFDSLRLFDCLSSAEAYKNQLTELHGYDYALLQPQTVCMESILAVS